MHLIAGVNRDTHHNSIASSQLRIGMGVLLGLLGPIEVGVLHGPAWSLQSGALIANLRQSLSALPLFKGALGRFVSKAAITLPMAACL